MVSEEGYIKFNCVWIKAEPLPEKELIDLGEWRQRLHELKLVGVYENGVGYGNLSKRRGKDFIITGSGTGGLPKLGREHYTLVKEFDLQKNSLVCEGPIKASSESLTHAVIYQADSSVNAVIHVHSKSMWKSLLKRIPTTSENASYGTPEMALEVLRLFKETNVSEKKIFAMAGHEEGIVSFGKNMEDAGNNLLKYYALI